MKISEQQLAQLISIAHGAMNGLSERGHDEASR